GKSYAEQSVDRVERAGDAWTGRWRAASTEACLASRVNGEQSAQVFALRSTCLDRQKRELLAVTKLLSKAEGPLVERAVPAIYALPDPAACSEARVASLSLASADAARADSLRDALASGNALYFMG